MFKINNKGFTLLESIASIVIISFVVVSIFTIIINVRTQTFAGKEQINAIEVGNLVRNELETELDYNDLSSVLNQDITVTYNDFSAISNFPSDVFFQTLDGKDYSTFITITFYEMTSSHTRFGVVDFTIKINYFSNREIELEGIIYE